MNKVSVIIPVYNRENYIIKCLKSIVFQKDVDEVIVVDDGSTDNTLDIVKNFSLENDKVKVVTQKNSGPASARKLGLSLSKNSRICFIDSDDTVSKNYFYELNKTMNETGANIVFSKIALHPNIKPIDSFYIIYNTYKAKDGVISLKEHKEVLPKLNVPFTSSMYKREYIEIEDYSFSANEDLALTAYLYQKADKIGFSNKAIYHYFQSENSTCKKFICNGIDFSKISNVLLPLEQLKINFINNNVDDFYYDEVEAIFIKNIFQRIHKICSVNISSETKKELSNILLNFITYHYPNWLENKYLNGSLKDFCLGDYFDFKSGIKALKTMNMKFEPMNYEEVKKNYNKCLSKQKK